LDRKAWLLKHIDPATAGIEVAPYFNPILAKRDGHPVLILDVFDTETLRRNAAKDPHIPKHRIDEIEAVDIVTDASAIGEAVLQLGRQGQFQYILSSHNFEHLPNPIRFLQGCSVALAPGGVVSMAVPDGRACLDIFRMPTRLSDWLNAYHRNQDQPSPESIFDFRINYAQFYHDGRPQTGCDISRDDPSGFRPENDLSAAYAEYLMRIGSPQPYLDTHCTVTFGAALENMLWDLRFLGLIDLDIIEVTETRGLEFCVHLRKPVYAAPLDQKEFYAARAQRLHQIARSLGTAGYRMYGPGQFKGMPVLKRLTLGTKRALRKVVPERLYTSVRTWNRRRKGRRT
jgi:SAM-dependent methyltransferase